MTVAASPPRARRRDWIGLAVIALPCMLYSMDLTVLNLAVPHLSADLKPSSVQLLWIIDIYGFLVAGSLLTMGNLGDRIGRRKMLLIGAVAFGAASVVAAFSTTAEMLIASRALLGLAGATIAPSTMSLIRNMFHDNRERTVAISIWVTSYSVGALLGPPVGGVLLEFFWWGSVFLLAVPVMALLLVLGPLLLPEFKDPGAGRIDLLSAALSLGAVLPAIYGLKQFAQGGLGWQPIAAILLGLTVGALFVRRQRTLADPLIDLRLFRSTAFSVSLATYGLAVFITVGPFIFIYQYLQLVLGLSPLEAGLWMVPSSAAFVVGSMVTPAIVRRLRAPYVMASGLAVAAVGFLVLTQVGGLYGLPAAVTGTFIFSFGLSPVVILATDLIIGTAPPERAGAASGISETSAEFGGALGIAIMGSLGVALYRGRMADAIPSGIPDEAAEAARDTLGGAVAIAAQLPADAAAALLETARAAFLQGFVIAAIFAAAVTTILAVVAGILLRNVRAPSGPPEQAAKDPAPTAP